MCESFARWRACVVMICTIRILTCSLHLVWSLIRGSHLRLGTRIRSNTYHGCILWILKQQVFHFLEEIAQGFLVLLPLDLESLHLLFECIDLTFKLIDPCILLIVHVIIHGIMIVSIKDAASCAPYPYQLSPLSKLPTSESSANPCLDSSDSPSKVLQSFQSLAYDKASKVSLNADACFILRYLYILGLSSSSVSIHLDRWDWASCRKFFLLVCWNMHLWHVFWNESLSWPISQVWGLIK